MKFYVDRFVLIKPPIPHNHLDRGFRSDLLIGLVLFVDDQKPVKYLFPSTVWQTPNQLFTNSSIDLRAMDQACVMLALAGARNVRPALLMLGGLVLLNARWQKTFLLNLHRLNRHSRTRCAWPG